MKSSKSVRRRVWFSSRVTDSRLVSQPNSCSFMATWFCVQPLRSRNFRTCWPTTFSGELEASRLMPERSNQAAVVVCALLTIAFLDFACHERTVFGKLLPKSFTRRKS